MNRHHPAADTGRREFLAAACVGAAALLTGCHESSPTDPNSPDGREPAATMLARPGSPSLTATKGFTPLGLKNQFTGRDGLLYVPSSYDASKPAPFIVALHGAGFSSAMWSSQGWTNLLDEFGIVMLAPDSRGFASWDLLEERAYGVDVRFIDDALALAFRKCRVDPARTGIVGFSDGASEALGLGIINGDLFRTVVGFSPGEFVAPIRRGTPRVLISHGTEDTVLSYSADRDFIVPAIRALGLTVTFSSFEGGHTVPAEIGRQGLAFSSGSAG